MAAWQFPQEVALWIRYLAETLDARICGRLAPLFLGVLFAQGRRTVAAWLRAIAARHDFRAYYYFLGSLGRKVEWVAFRLLLLLERHLPTEDRLLFAIDDTPTKRYGPLVEGAGLHHNPTPGPVAAKFLYGHVWVTLARVVRHHRWGTIALPLLARLYVRLIDIGRIVPWYRWKFKTKLELAAELVEWVAKWLCYAGKTFWIVVDGFYAKRPFLGRAMAAGATVVGRLRKDAKLFTVPKPPRPGERRRGRPRKYGTERISLAKRAGHRSGWQRDEFELYGQAVRKRYKTFLATWQPVGGVIRVVLVQESHGWLAFFCTDPEASVAEILEAVADRGSLEQGFHDIKEVHGAGQQQLRNIWANVAAYHLNLWMHTLVELWGWRRSHRALCDRRESPWDDADRRPSHADRRNALRRECLEAEFSRIAGRGAVPRIIRQLLERLTRLAA